MSDLKNFRGPLPLGDADLAAIRASVMAKIENRRQPFAFVWRFAFVASVIAVLSVIIGTQPAVAPAPGKPRVLITAVPPPRPQPQPAPIAVKVAQKQRKHPVRPRPAEVAAVARMEIQTSDPDIRIIWISNSDSR